MAKRYIVTSALPYINGVKHLGNLIGSLLPADVLARYLRQQGHDVLCVCGTDEHGTPAEIAAKDSGMTVRAYCDQMYLKQKAIYDGFDLSFDYFGRTSSPENHKMTQHLFRRLEGNGFVEEKVIQQVYSPEDGRYLPDRFIVGTCPHCGATDARGDQCENCTRVLDPVELIEPRSALSGSTKLEIRDTNHLFIRLSVLEDVVRQWLSTRDRFPRNTLSIGQAWLNQGLRDRCITRDLEWGVPVPKDGYEKKVFYVWFDAPIGYIGISMEWARQKGDPDLWKTYWKNPETELIQFMAKDNVPFHTITWPATMLGADDGFVMASMIKGFQWLQYEGGKFSTSKNRGIFTDAAIELYPSDWWRYHLLATAPESSDSNFTWEIFQGVINKDLNDVLGNFVHRSLTFTNRFLEGKVPPCGPLTPVDTALRTEVERLIKEAGQALEGCEIGKTMRAIRAIWAEANKYLDDKAPWTARKQNPEDCGTTMNHAINLCRTIAITGFPFIPATAKKLAAMIGLKEDLASTPWSKAADWDGLPAGSPIDANPVALFTKIPDEEVEKLQERFGGKRVG